MYVIVYVKTTTSCIIVVSSVLRSLVTGFAKTNRIVTTAEIQFNA